MLVAFVAEPIAHQYVNSNMFKLNYHFSLEVLAVASLFTELQIRLVLISQ